MRLLNMEGMVLGAIILLTGLLIFGSLAENKAWQKFKVEHNCKVVAKTSPTTGTGIGMTTNGNVATVVTTSPGKTGWECDDGVTYWR